MKYIAILIFCLCYVPTPSAQILKGLGKKIERSVKRRVDQKTSRAIEQGLDQVEAGMKGIGKQDSVQIKGNENTKSIPSAANQTGLENRDTMQAGFGLYTNFDFVPGNELLFYDDFSTGRPGDFPSGWNTNGSGEIVTTGDETERYFWLKGGALYLPVLSGPLPDAFTLEFDLKTRGLNEQISSTTYLDISLDESRTFQMGSKRAIASISFCQYISNGVYLLSVGGPMGTIENTITEDYRKAMLNDPHVSIAVNQGRFRLWVNAKKLVDAPTFIPAGASFLKLNLRGFSSDFKQMQVLIDEVKIAAGGLDLHDLLTDQGKWSTTGIRFDTGSAQVRPESYAVLKQVAGVLQDNPGLRIRIVGHTDSDGSEALNLQLSKERAARVKGILSGQFGIASDRLESAGKGASSPITDNRSAADKARNRRVEFIKI